MKCFTDQAAFYANEFEISQIEKNLEAFLNKVRKAYGEEFYGGMKDELAWSCYEANYSVEDTVGELIAECGPALKD